MLKTSQINKGVIAGILAMLLWGLIPVIFKAGVSEVSPSSLLLVRFLFSLIVFVPFLFKNNFAKIFSKSPKIFLSITAVLLTMYFCFSGALKNMDASTYIIITALNPIVSLLLLNFKITKKILLTLILAVAGTILSAAGSGLEFSKALLSTGYIFAGIISWAAYTKLLVKTHNDFSDIESSAITHILSALACTIWWFCDGMPLLPANIEQLSLAALFGVISPIAFFLFSFSMRLTPIFGVLSQFLDPVFGLIFAFLLLGDKLTSTHLIACSLILIALWISKDPTSKAE